MPGRNRLAGETSPYLQQHKDNPVDWWPWCDDAFAEARQRDVPVLLSVGYSACHWCHVMAHESFEDGATAAVMNDLFVNVKVDREERPDVDAIYMDATQAMTGRGGWPMTVFMTPGGEPFYCGTYFPRAQFVELCRRVAEAWLEHRDDLEQHAGKLVEAVGRTALIGTDSTGDATGIPGAEALAGAYQELRRQHDDEWGGFGSAPKFPQTMSHELLLRAHAHNDSPVTAAMVQTSLDCMASGGIYDHLGGGFARYSVDHVWLVPHFEKMLYDQALLARLYLHAWQATGEARYRQVLDETVEYVLRDLRHPDGGFFSAEDADSEGEEGRFYVWSLDEVRTVAGQEAADWYGVTAAGNFERHNILNRMAARGDLQRPPSIEDARRALFEARLGRVRPGLDDKVLTEWNGLMLATLAEAAAATGNREWLDAARACASFLLSSLRRSGDGRLLRAWKDGDAKTLGFAADHAALTDGLTRLAEATGEARWIGAAIDTAEAMLGLFWDDEGGCLFTTGHDAERLVTRPKDLLDNATPSANSLAAVALLRLGALTGIDRYTGRATEILGALGPVATQHPTAFGHLLAAVDLVTTGITEIAVVGDRPDLVAAVQQSYLPNAVLAWGEPYDSPLWQSRHDGFAYVCRDYTCQAPVDSVDALVAQLA